MANINLLPWREDERKELTQQFLVVMGVCAAIAGLIVVGVHVFVGNQIDYQKDRNTFLGNEIVRLDKELKQIKDLENTKEKLLSRMEVIQSLQLTRPQVVHLFDEFVRTIPEGIYLNKITQRGRKLTINGVAESNGRVSAYMRNIDNSDWMKTPKLKVIKTKNGSFRSSDFILNTKTSSPKPVNGGDS